MYYAFRNDYGYAIEYAYQDCECIFRTKHAQLVTKPYTYRYSCSRL